MGVRVSRLGRRVAVALLVAACAPMDETERPEPSPSLLAQAIVGGTTDFGDPEVFMLLQEYSNGQQSGCTSTLIGSRTLLTAAHCVDPRIAGATSMTIWAMNKTYVNQATSADLIRVIETRMHPGWNPNVGLDHDIAMALLERSPNLAPKPWNETDIRSFGGRPLRAVGYGTTGQSGTGSGVKRTVDLTFRQISSTHIALGDQTGKGVCHGDSGGPSFHRFSDGVERVVGVHSFTANQACTDGADIRVDAYASFVRQWLAEKEAPTCGQDGRCVSGCTPTVDPDCCGVDGTCSLEACTADPDCVPDGQRCTSELQCKSRLCASDPQHPEFYCTRRCSTAAECQAGMECFSGVCRFRQLPTADLGQGCTIGQTFCTGGSVCTGPQGGPTTCSSPCAVQADCPADSTCEGGVNGLRYCRVKVKPLVFLPRAVAQGRVAGCSSVGGAPMAAFALALAVLRRRR